MNQTVAQMLKDVRKVVECRLPATLWATTARADLRRCLDALERIRIAAYYGPLTAADVDKQIAEAWK